MIDLYPYGDGITKVSDPFWLNACPGCGHMFWSCSYALECPVCKGPGLARTLGGVPYEQVAARRGGQGEGQDGPDAGGG